MTVDWNQDLEKIHGAGGTEEAEAADPFAAFGMTKDELFEAVDLDEPLAKRDGRVCSCGHPMAKHFETDPYMDGNIKRSCEPVKTVCKCKNPKPVLEASDMRPFLRKTLGQREKHALMRGVVGLMSKEGRTFTWLEGWPQCELAPWPVVECQASSGVQPYSVSATGWLRPETEVVTYLVCEAHAMALAEHGMPGVER